MSWQARLFGKALGPVRCTRAAAYDDLVQAGHATQDDYAPYRIWPIVPAEVSQVGQIPSAGESLCQFMFRSED